MKPFIPHILATLVLPLALNAGASTPAQTPAATSASTAARASVPASLIRPGALWPDDRGQHINAHGGGITKVGDTWYWFGEYRPKKQEQERGKHYVSCYASTDLANWKFLGLALNSPAPDNIGQHWVLERPKVYHNTRTGKFVMWMHIDGPRDPSEKVDGEDHMPYALARVGVAVSDKAEGPYTFVRTFRPLGKESRDIGQFVDDDGTAYLIFESRPTHGFFIAKLTDDYLGIAEQTAFIKAPLEGGALVHYDGLYYLVASHLSGWTPNANLYATAKNIAGPWTAFKNIAPPEVKTYGSQSTMLLKVAGTKTTTVIFMGDQWRPKTQWDSRYLWMPLQIGAGKLWLPEPRPWAINVTTGETAFLKK